MNMSGIMRFSSQLLEALNRLSLSNYLGKNVVLRHLLQQFLMRAQILALYTVPE